jgi:hypothetical protein
MDLELLFSTSPFIKEDGASSLFVSPNLSQSVELRSDQPSARIDVPEALRNANMYVEVLGPGSGVSKCRTFYSHSLIITMIDKYGQVKVTDKSGKPVAAYIKVYYEPKPEHGSLPDFYKDGYTDSRGRFDYASISTAKLPKVKRFSVLISTDSKSIFKQLFSHDYSLSCTIELGSAVREAAPPPV